MARTKIDVQGVINVNTQMDAARKTVNTIRNDLNWTREKISGSVLKRNNLNARLHNVSNNLLAIENRMNRIRNVVENGANSYKNTDGTVVAWRAELNGKIAKKIVVGVGAGSLVPFETVKQATDKVELKEQEAIGDMLWEDLNDGFKDNIWGNIGSDLANAALESGGIWASKVAARHINLSKALAHGPAGAQSFIILDSKVISKTAAMTKNVSTGLKVGLPIIGGVIDFVGMKKGGAKTEDAFVKSTVHVGIGAVGGKAGAAVGAAIGSVIPGAGTAVGGAIGFVAGVAVTTVGNVAFDAVYDNRDAIHSSVANAWKNTKTYVSGVGNAWVSGWRTIGSAFG